MMTGRDLVILSDDWNGLPTSAIHLFRRLARANRVFWFNTVGRMPRPTLADAGKVLRVLGSWAGGRRAASGAREIPPGLHLVNPIMVPWFKPLVRRFNRFSLLRKYRRLCLRHDITDPILLTTFPYAVDFLKAVPDAVKVYYCVDDFLDYPGVNQRDWARMEAELLGTVDGLIVTARTLARKRVTDCPLLHLPHGVDYEHFQVPATAEPVPALEALPRPVVGFFGLLSSWVDQEVIADLSEHFPEVSFVLLGRSEVGLERLATRPNVHCLGFVPYAELPRYARYFDVGLIPFVLNRLTRAVNPVKLMEYLALGVPVLSTRLPELETMDGPIHLAETREEFRAGLRAALAQCGPEARAEARAVARQNTWDRRAEQLGEFLEALAREPLAA
jgi:glycosyltransferase involved in cell wall biosynthesis